MVYATLSLMWNENYLVNGQFEAYLLKIFVKNESCQNSNYRQGTILLEKKKESCSWIFIEA